MQKPPYIVIMAGGVGSRFWPASREYMPKQFLDITGSGKSLIQSTFERFTSFIPADRIYVITNEYYREQTQRALPGMDPAHIICEPSRNNTAATVALASFKLFRIEQDAVCVVAPSDHIIQNESEFQRVISLAVDHAYEQSSFITLGIQPSRPDTGYGYIEFSPEDESPIRKVSSFREKPDEETAKKYLRAGNYVWNAGLFIWRLDRILEAYKLYSPQIYNVLAQGHEYYNTELEADFLRKEYPLTEKTSVDYAILEKAPNVYTIPCDLGWSDLGTWNSLYDISNKDANKNAALTDPVFLENTKDCLVLAKNEKLIVTSGLDGYIIVDTDDCLMIYPKSEEQNIKKLKEKLSREGLDGYL